MSSFWNQIGLNIFFKFLRLPHLLERQNDRGSGGVGERERERLIHFPNSHNNYFSNSYNNLGRSSSSQSLAFHLNLPCGPCAAFPDALVGKAKYGMTEFQVMA